MISNEDKIKCTKIFKFYLLILNIYYQKHFILDRVTNMEIDMTNDLCKDYFKRKLTKDSLE